MRLRVVEKVGKLLVDGFIFLRYIGWTPGISSAVNACANALQWQHALRLLKKPPVPWRLQNLTGCPAHKWLRQKKMGGVCFSDLLILAGFCFKSVRLEMCSVPSASIFWVRYAEGGRKSLQTTIDKHMQQSRKISAHFHCIPCCDHCDLVSMCHFCW